ncbi:MAG: hypothetical protein WDA16_00360 [Candidatus Thermoplasmatota archaeon]
MSPRTVALILAAFLAVPAVATLVSGHSMAPDGSVSMSDAAQAGNDLAPPVSGYTGPGRAPYINFFEGVWVYGQASATPLGNQYPIDLKGWGDWIVWDDARKGDVYAYNIPAGTGQYITSDTPLQRNADISHDVIVWEDYRNNTHSDVYAYFLQTGEVRRISDGPGNHRQPSIDGDIITWASDGDIWAHNLSNQTQFPVFTGPDKESDPLVLGHTVYFRTYRFNVWDVMAVDLDTNETRQITSDIAINGAPFTNGEDVFFLTQYLTAWGLDKYEVANDRIVHTPLKFQDTTPTPIVGDHLINAIRERVYRQIVAENVTTGDTTHVSGSLMLSSEPYVTGRTVYAPVLTKNGTNLLVIDVSPFAFAKRPTLVVTNPKSGMPWLQPIVVEGDLLGSRGFADPATFTYRVDDGVPAAVPTLDHFRFALDPAGAGPGRHTVTLRATYREGPPVEKSFTLLVPNAADTLDVAKLGQQFHTARAFGAIDVWFVENPASYFVILLGVFILVMLIVRAWYMLKPKRRRVTIEYVSAEEN